MVKKRGLFSLVGLVLFLAFVFAASSSPTAVVFNNNVTLNYDEGDFFLNWTSGGGDEINYTIWVSTDSGVTWFTSADNTSTTGYKFSNTTSANYTFKVQAVNATLNSANSSNVSLYVDSGVPTLTLPSYTNATAKKNTATVALNISVADALSGLTGSFCFVDVNGTNETLAVSSGWCNSTAFDLTGLSDGNSTISVYVNDTVGNIGLNNSYFIQADTTAPTVTLPTFTNLTSHESSDTMQLNVYASDSTSGAQFCIVNVTSTNQTFSVSSGWCNTTGVDLSGLSSTFHPIRIYVNDSAGNIGSNSSYYVQVSSSSTDDDDDSSSSGSTTSFWKYTYPVTTNAFMEGYNRGMLKASRIRMNINGDAHYLGVVDITSSAVIVNVSSEVQQATITEGEEKKFDVELDGYYDVLVTLHDITQDSVYYANISIISINETVPEENQIVPSTDSDGSNETDLGANNQDGTGNDSQEGGSTKTFIIVLVVIVIGGIIGVILYKMKGEEAVGDRGRE